MVSLSAQWERSIGLGLVIPIQHTFTRCRDGAFEFAIFQAKKSASPGNLPKKTNNCTASPSSSPFLGLGKEEKLAEWPKHNLIFNKFPIFPSHLLVVTKEFIPQITDLDLEDFISLYRGIGAFSSSSWLVFYNCGVHSGASQMHKHIQIIPSIDWIPLDDVISGEGMREIWCFDFWHWLKVEDFGTLDGADIQNTAMKAYSTYSELLGKCKETLGNGCTSYNFLMTGRWMFIVGRRGDSEKSSLNSLAFAGFLLQRNEEEKEFIKKRGILRMLKDVCY
jgi:ATP adenylyltransferase